MLESEEWWQEINKMSWTILIVDGKFKDLIYIFRLMLNLVIDLMDESINNSKHIIFETKINTFCYKHH
ncbi:hypothetical protein QE152_g23365 [Popillia japonica]|uniref:Uncharacterized protein n=1 Tax=Popillia japonica TaxID=7064 RepID=A0AAW1KH48_POPJA